MRHHLPQCFFVLLTCAACAPGDDSEPDAATEPFDGSAPDRSTSMDSAMVDAPDIFEDTTQDVPVVRYTRDVRPLLEASECGACHRDILTMDYAWISAPGETWCSPGEYEHRYDCFEEHARTQARRDSVCVTDFYHRHGEPCFDDETKETVLAWAAGGYLE